MQISRGLKKVSVGEIINTQSEAQEVGHIPTLSELADYDESIGERILEIQAGASPNGHYVDLVGLEKALAGNEFALAHFEKEYSWALRLATFGYRGREDEEDLMSAARVGLYEAATAHADNPDEEPNFLRRLSGTLSFSLRRAFPETQPNSSILLENFEDFVLAEGLSDLPPLADSRPTSTFCEGQKVLYLRGDNLENEPQNGRLVVATVKKAVTYEGPNLTLGPPVRLPEREITTRQEWLEKREKELREENYISHLAPDPEWLKLKMSLQPEFQVVIPNPSPGFLHLTFEDDSLGITGIDMNRNTVITAEEWAVIRQDSAYRRAWISHGSKESLRKSEALLVAVNRSIFRFFDSGAAAPAVNGSSEKTVNTVNAKPALEAVLGQVIELDAERNRTKKSAPRNKQSTIKNHRLPGTNVVGKLRSLD